MKDIEVLIVEDSRTQAEAYAEVLREVGYAVTTAPDGRAALTHLRTYPTQLVISDVVMQEMDGYELCAQIRAEPALADIPVLLLTQLNEPADIIKGLECGADSFLIKNAAEDDRLLARVKSLLLDHQQAREQRIDPVIEVTFANHRYRLGSSRLQMLDLLLAQYEESKRQQRELVQTHAQLSEAFQAIQTLSQLIHDNAIQPPPTKINRVIDLLIAEDSTTQAAALQAVMEEYGYQVRVAANGRLALDAIRERKPDVIISDVVMPEMDGFDFCRTLKDDPAFIDIPVIMLTSLTDPQDIVRGLAAKADYYLTKPCDPIHLLTRVKYLLDNPVKHTGQPEPLEAVIGGQSTTISSQPQQILNLLLSTYEQAVKQNRTLAETQLELRDLNEQLEQRVTERTAALESEIAERKLAEKELRSFRVAVAQSGTPIVITDAQGTIEYVNPAFETNTGYAQAEALGQTPRILKSGEQGEGFYNHLWTTIRSGQIWRGQLHNRRKDGSLYWESANISPVLNEQGEIVRFIAIKEDITERKAMESQLNAALIDAHAAVKAKGEFLAVMSHELRTPLNGVLGFAELLADSLLDPEQKDYARTITASGNHLLAVVNDILDFSSIENGTLAIKGAPLFLADLMHWTIAATQQAAADKALEIRREIAPDVPEQFVGDERRIHQILLNLLGNAVKFTDTGAVVLRVTLAMVDDCPYLDFSVEDSGIGIQPEAYDRLFKPFSQADSSISRKFGGTGLGLAISKRLAEAMGGSLTVISTPGQGSTFTFRFPLEASDHPRAADTNPPQSAEQPSDNLSLTQSNINVLVVEDHPISSILVGKMLKLLGCRTVFAYNGREAIEKFATGEFSAILMDMSMPVMDGLTATTRIRNLEAVRGSSPVPIIAITGNVMPGDHQRCLAAGMTDFLSKPYKKDDLAEKLRLCLLAK